MQQHTLRRAVSLQGIGLHSGREVTITLRPAAPDTGIVFCRTDIPAAPPIPADAAHIADTRRATGLAAGGVSVHTVEHLLAALVAMDVDNAAVDISAAEPPLGDGSALTFVRLIQEAGLTTQERPRRARVITRPLWVRHPDKFIVILPHDGWRISFTSLNPCPAIAVQYGDFAITPDTFVQEIAPARTVGFLQEIEALKAQGLGLGGSLETVAVYDEHGCPVAPLRFADELVRHKILDVIGDLALAGPVRGHVIAVKSGHALNAELTRLIAASVEKA